MWGGGGTRTETGIKIGTTGTCTCAGGEGGEGGLIVITGVGGGGVGVFVIICSGVFDIEALGEYFFELWGDCVGVITGFFGVREASLTGDCIQEDPVNPPLELFLLLVFDDV